MSARRLGRSRRHATPPLGEAVDQTEKLVMITDGLFVEALMNAPRCISIVTQPHVEDDHCFATGIRLTPRSCAMASWVPHTGLNTHRISPRMCEAICSRYWCGRSVPAVASRSRHRPIGLLDESPR